MINICKMDICSFFPLGITRQLQRAGRQSTQCFDVIHHQSLFDFTHVAEVSLLVSLYLYMPGGGQKLALYNGGCRSNYEHYN